MSTQNIFTVVWPYWGIISSCNNCANFHWDGQGAPTRSHNGDACRTWIRR